MTRKGKIARLPSVIRHELNSRLDDGEPGKDLVVWLNGLDKVREVLAKEFGGRPVTEQNLSEWKQGGFLDWQQAQEACGRLRDLVELSDQLTSASPDQGIADRLAALLSIEFAAETRTILQQIADPTERWEYLRQAIPKMNILRDGDHKAARERRRMGRWKNECDDRQWEEKKAMLQEAYEQCVTPYELRRKRDTLLSAYGDTDYDIKHIEAMLAAQLKYKPHRYIKPSDEPLWGSPKSNPTKIQPDPTKSR